MKKIILFLLAILYVGICKAQLSAADCKYVLKYSAGTTMVPALKVRRMCQTPSSLQVWALTRIAVEPLCPGFIPTRDSIFRSGEKDPYQCAVQRCDRPSAKA